MPQAAGTCLCSPLAQGQLKALTVQKWNACLSCETCPHNMIATEPLQDAEAPGSGAAMSYRHVSQRIDALFWAGQTRLWSGCQPLPALFHKVPAGLWSVADSLVHI